MFRKRFGEGSGVEKQHIGVYPMHSYKAIPLERLSDEDFKVSRSDVVYRQGTWDGSPIVLEEYRLIFFTIPKVACTVFKQLFRRIMGFPNWHIHDDIYPHDPRRNGLKYLSQYPKQKATSILLNPNYIKAMFVRDPKERFLSAYLDKAYATDYVYKRCCPTAGACKKLARNSLEGFLKVASVCYDPHWNPYTYRMEPKYWPLLNFIGSFETLQNDTQRLLERMGNNVHQDVWQTFGASGWGKDGTEGIFESHSSVIHATHSQEKFLQHYTPKLERIVEKFYDDDYQHPMLQRFVQKET
mmetsp:Transcript_28386/g.65893  ORF Transcript_28386/g.65893 Transcript_28386/m.65893 type:complete len:298 (+) Transcript_28386:139-1032(+)